MVNKRVAGLVRADCQDQVAHLGVWGQLPVRNASLGCRLVLPEMTGIDVVQQVRVRLHCFLLQVADNRMAELGCDKVGHKEHVEVQPLCQQHRRAELPVWLAQLQERQQVHALVLRLLQERRDPALVRHHDAQRAQVAQHAAHHAWHAGDRLQEDGPAQPLQLGLRLAWRVGCGPVKGCACALDRPVRHLFRQIARRLVRGLHAFEVRRVIR
mmetsp:Transcript_16550/g.49345  ORF Transcript_16550/g.49345 Transcript_16550/m.49345 type:complete len:212 (+) Transcript_16550:4545-5180(+)